MINRKKITKTQLHNDHRACDSVIITASDASLSQPEKIADDLLQLLYELQFERIDLIKENQELKEVRLQLQDSLLQYMDQYDFAPIGYLSFDDKGCIHEANHTAAHLLGTERSHLIGKPFVSYLMKRDVRKFRQHIQQCKKGEENSRTILSLATEEGGSMEVQLTSTVFMDNRRHIALYRTALTEIVASVQENHILENESGEVHAVTNASASLAQQDDSIIENQIVTEIFDEITNSIKKANLRLAGQHKNLDKAVKLTRALTRAKTNFLKQLCQELKTPVNDIIKFSELLQVELFGKLNDHQHEYVRDIQVRGKLLMELLFDIFGPSKPQ